MSARDLRPSRFLYGLSGSVHVGAAAEILVLQIESPIACVNYTRAYPKRQREIDVGCTRRQPPACLCAGMHTSLSTCSISHQARTSQTQRSEELFMTLLLTSDCWVAQEQRQLTARWLCPLRRGMLLLCLRNADVNQKRKKKNLPVSFHQRYETRDAGGENKRRQMSLAVNWKMQLCKQSSTPPLTDSWSVCLMHNFDAQQASLLDMRATVAESKLFVIK